MPMSQGLTVMGDYVTPAAINAKLAALLTAIPNPDVAPAQQGVKGYLDEMSPMCAAQLRNEITVLQTNARLLKGSYTVLAGDVTATFAALPDPGFLPTLANTIIDIRRAGAAVGANSVQTLNGNNVRVASSGTYVLTAGDVINYAIMP